MPDDEKPQSDSPDVATTPDIKEAADKLAEAAPAADPGHAAKTDLLAGVKKVDETILRLNK